MKIKTNTDHDILELHYFLENESHSMDAFIRNKCESDLLLIVKEINELLGNEVKIETSAYKEGGLVETWEVISSNSYLVGILTGIFINIASSYLAKDHELSNLQKEDLRLSIARHNLELQKMIEEKSVSSLPVDQLKSFISQAVKLLNSEYTIIRHRSEFYRKLLEYPKVHRIESQMSDNPEHLIDVSLAVDREEFDRFVLHTDELPIEVDENAEIEIISPVLKRGRYKWRGIYHGDTIDFYMQDTEFKQSIANQAITFKNGMYITCHLELKKKIDDLGKVYTSRFTVITVLSYSDGKRQIETSQGRHLKHVQEVEKNQTDLFDRKVPNKRL